MTKQEYIVRTAPPLVITKAEIDWAFDRINDVITSLEAHTGMLTTEKELAWRK